MELQRAADRNDMEGFYNGLTEVRGPTKKGHVHLKSTYGMDTFSDSKRVVARWSEHFQTLPNVPGDIDHEAMDNIPHRITKTSLDEIPTMAEMARAIAGLNNGKAPGGDTIPAEVWKHGGDNLFSKLHQLITNAWAVGSVSQAWTDASIITIYKKGDRTDCGISSSRQDLRQDPPQQNIYIHNTTGDTMWKPEYRGPDILSPTATRKVHLAGHGICRLQ